MTGVFEVKILAGDADTDLDEGTLDTGDANVVTDLTGTRDAEDGTFTGGVALLDEYVVSF